MLVFGFRFQFSRPLAGAAGLAFAGYVFLIAFPDVRRYIRVSYNVEIKPGLRGSQQSELTSQVCFHLSAPFLYYSKHPRVIGSYLMVFIDFSSIDYLSVAISLRLPFNEEGP